MVQAVNSWHYNKRFLPILYMNFLLKENLAHDKLVITADKLGQNLNITHVLSAFNCG